MRFATLLLLALPLALACGGAETIHEYGDLSRLSSVDGYFELCEHEVPDSVCVLCNPELEPQFRAVNDWCPPHHVPESQCHRCHRDLTFVPLPELEQDADYAELTHEQALEGLETWAVPGKITVFDFYATWCAPCQNLEVELFEMANANADVAVRKITIMDWEGPVVNRYLAAVSSLPHLRVFDQNGEEFTTLSGNATDRLAEVVEGLR